MTTTDMQMVEYLRLAREHADHATAVVIDRLITWKEQDLEIDSSLIAQTASAWGMARYRTGQAYAMGCRVDNSVYAAEIAIACVEEDIERAKRVLTYLK